jgi:hypothetical protein
METEQDIAFLADSNCASYTPEQWKDAANEVASIMVDEECTDEDVLRGFRAMQNLFVFGRDLGDNQVTGRINAIFDGVTDIKARIAQFRGGLRSIHMAMLTRHMLEDTPDGRRLKEQLTHINFSMKMVIESIATSRLLRHSTDHAVRASLEEMTPFTLFTKLDNANLKKNHQLINFLYHVAFKNSYRKHGGNIWKPMYNKEGESLHAYEYVSSIEEFIWASLHPHSENVHWLECMLERASTSAQCVNVLTKSQSEFLPTLVRNRYIHAFRNGLFVTTHNAFYHFKKKPGRRWVGELYGNRNLTASMYHDIVFREEEMEEEMKEYGYMGIRLANIHQILSTQKFTMEERKWILALFGRCLFNIGDVDSWGVQPYLLGLAGTGKGTILEINQALFPRDSVGILANNGHDKFPLEGIYDKDVYYGMDVDEHFNLDQATWQSMVVGEEVSVNIRHKPPKQLRWQSHGVFAGNRLPPWTDSGGNVARRLIIIEFCYSVSRCDPNLKTACRANIDRYLKVLVSAYQELANKYGDRGIKEVMPEKFKVSERKALLELNPLMAFVTAHCEVDTKPDKTFVQDFHSFTKRFKEFCRRNSMRAPTLNYSYCNAVFAKFQIKIVDNPVRGEDPHGQEHKYIEGLRFRGNFIDDGD